MKTLLLVLASLFLIYGGSMAQPAGEKAIARILYAFAHVDDTSQRDNPYREEFILYIGTTGSRYTSYTAIQNQAEIQKQVATLREAREQGSTNLSIDLSGKTKPSSSTQYLTLPAEGTMTVIEKLFRTQYLISEPLEAITWDIVDETKEIGGYRCQKATGDFRGRHYVAWFAPDLPFPYGPWKLHGLPGLILEAVDTRGDVAFRYAGFETLNDSDAFITPPAGGVASTRREYEKARGGFKKNPQAAMNASMAASGRANVRVITSFVQHDDDDNTEKKKVVNNPLELNDN